MILIDDYTDMVARPELSCGFECVKDGLEFKNVREYKGPVKIVVVRSPESDYYLKMRGAAGLAFLNFLIGAINMVILLREAAAVTGDSNARMHVIMCTLGLTFFSNIGMLNMYKIYGPVYNLKPKDAKRQHILFHAVGVVVAFMGGVFYMSEADTVDVTGQEMHVSVCIIGLLGSCGSFITGIVASMKKFRNEKFIILHVAVSVGTAFFYTICFTSGLTHTYMKAFCTKCKRGCETLTLFQVLIFVGVVLSSLYFILYLFKQTRKTITICVPESEVEKYRRKEQEEIEEREQEMAIEKAVHETLQAKMMEEELKRSGKTEK